MKTTIAAIVVAAAVAIVIAGCSSSEETASTQPPPQPSASEVLQQQLADCQSENAGLKTRATQLEQDSKSSAARVTDLESQLADLKANMPAARPAAKMRDPRAGYENALTLFRTRSYADATAALQAALDANPPADLEDNCEYWLGECAYAMKNYRGALAHFEKVFSFSRSEKKDDAQIMIANSYHAMGDRTRAKAEYEKLLEKYPASPYAQRAKEKLAKL